MSGLNIYNGNRFNKIINSKEFSDSAIDTVIKSITYCCGKLKLSHLYTKLSYFLMLNIECLYKLYLSKKVL